MIWRHLVSSIRHRLPEQNPCEIADVEMRSSSVTRWQRGAASLFQWIISTVSQSGYGGIVLLMFLENVFPPIPSELIMPLAGFAAARGDLNMAGVIAAGTIGSILGALPWYYAGRWVGSERLKRLAARHGRWMTVSPADIDTAETWFNRHCGKAVLIGRLIRPSAP
jgi:membrane protein DedA with SNARE-associated domain